jgi:hypothetical protein
MTNNYSRVERWWIPDVVVVMAIGIADFVFCHRKSKGG